MKINNILTLLLFGTFIIFSCHSPKEIYEDDYSQIDTIFNEEITQKIEKIVIYTNSTFNPKIKTILCHKTEEELSLPIINLDSDETLLVSFDDLDADIKNYYFTIIHCNADWKESELMKSEYISGFTNEPITDY